MFSQIAVFILTSVAFLQNALAQSYDYTYSSSDSAASGAAGLFICGLWICLAIFGLAALVFNIWALIDVSKRSEAELPNKNMWLILLIVGLLMQFGFIVAVVYYFSVVKTLGKAKSAS